MKAMKIGHNKFEILPVMAGSVTTRFIGSPHCHNYAEIWYVLRGEVRHLIRDREYLQTPGSFALVRAYNSHTFDTTVSEETPVIFSAAANEKALEGLGFDCFLRHFNVATIDGKEIPEFIVLSGALKQKADFLARSLLDEAMRKHPDSPKKRCSLFVEFLKIISNNAPYVRISKGLREKTQLINDAVDYILSNYNKKISLDFLCERTHMSKRRFTDNFKSVTGMTTGELLWLKRAYQADQLLVFTEKNLEEIAKETGFYDKSSFSHAFTDFFGITPIEYRRKHTEASYKQESGERLKRAHRYDILNYYYALAHNGEQLPKSYVSNMPNLLDE